ncbi:hypothetical protein BGZ65_005028 [Modicella reniformis]|uniref:Uncharacterized protein n=1 Tax=Modicella reniformis TaxID=1440133 RepID=A0A9P6SVA1_9FUNG|nr:hypothetical protein BGZ65_005028 [Modicella reniformis]
MDPNLPVLLEISFGPQGGRMATEERMEYLRHSHLFECNCSACNDRYAEAVLKKIYKCPKNGSSCRPITEKDKTCPTCRVRIDIPARQKMHEMMVCLISDSHDPELAPSQRLKLLKTLESAQSRTFVDTSLLYGNTCDQLALAYAETGDLTQSIAMQVKEAMKQVQIAITLYKGHYGADSRHPDLLELYEMEKVLRPLV